MFNQATTRGATWHKPQSRQPLRKGICLIVAAIHEMLYPLIVDGKAA
jgi:hypothetical protein